MDLKNLLNEHQYNAATDINGVIMVLAGAGSGKTRVLTYRIAYMIAEKKINPYNILAITFTNKAANEMKERINKIADCGENVWVSTFHAMASKILRMDIHNLTGYNSNFSIYTESDSKSVLNKLLKNEDEDSKIKKYIKHHISQIKNSLISPEKYVRDHDLDEGEEIIRLFYEYENELKNCNALDFDDLLVLLHKLLKMPSICEKYQNRFHYVLVDEFQDTNLLQYEIVKMLCGKHKNLFVVGDEDQSIYGWRGANINNLLNFKHDFMDAKLYKLEENYRSTKLILDAANNLIKNNKQRIGKMLYTNNSSTGSIKIDIKFLQRDRDEAEYVSESIYSLVKKLNYEYKDIAVLVRLNSLSRLFEQRFSYYNIPYVVYGGLKFYERKEIKDLLAYLFLTANPKDDVSLKRIINFPKRAIGETTIAKLEDFAKINRTSMLNAIDYLTLDLFNASTLTKLKAFKSVMDRFIELSSMLNMLDFVNMAVKTLDFANSYKDDESEERINNIIEFISSVSEYQENNPDNKLVDFLQAVSLSSDIDEDNDNDNKVRIATVHSVKGLEFKVVFLIGMEEGNFPVSRALDNTNELEEERRIAYVAITRARERLYVSYVGSRFKFNRFEYNMVSRFVAELSGESIKSQQSNFEKQVRISQEMIEEKHTGSIFVKEKSETKVIGFKVNQFVEHPKFGKGLILKLEGSIGDVAFENHGIKKLNMEIAPLTILK